MKAGTGNGGRGPGVGNRLVMLDEGRIIADGTPDEFRACPDVRVQRFIRGDAGYDGKAGNGERGTGVVNGSQSC